MSYLDITQILGLGWKVLEFICQNIFRCTDRKLLK
jgi:hypothetical protein